MAVTSLRARIQLTNIAMVIGQCKSNYMDHTVIATGPPLKNVLWAHLNNLPYRIYKRSSYDQVI